MPFGSLGTNSVPCLSATAHPSPASERTARPARRSEALKLLGDDLAAFCLKHFPETEGGLDYSHYLDHVYDESHATAE